jgi:hypothetical protein
MTRACFLALMGSLMWLVGCQTIPHQGLYENPVRSNYRQQYLAQNPQLPTGIRQAITSQRVINGMSRMDVMAAWGPPSSCSRILGSPDSGVVCFYKDTTTSVVLDRRYRDTTYKSVYFVHGIVVDSQYH